ncbi:MAG: GNAT family N-acetyltransferase, partial [Hyphomicrobiaceae bacterium]
MVSVADKLMVPPALAEWPAAAKPVQLAEGMSLTVDWFDRVEPVAEALTALQNDGLACVYQSVDWIENWIRHAAGNAGETPCLIMGGDEHGDVAFVWPMALRRSMGVTTLCWLGQSHFAQNGGCYRKDIARQLTRSDLLRIFAHLRASGLAFDALHLCNQPSDWNGILNPMLSLSRQRAPNANYEGRLHQNYDVLYREIFSARARRNHKRQRRRLAEFGEISLSIATDTGEQEDILETFFVQKSAQLLDAGAPNPFLSESMKDFYRGLLTGSQSGGIVPRFCGLRIDGELAATLIGVTDGRRFTTLMSAITMNDPAKASPGQQLLEYLVRDLCAHETETFDFGPGPSTQKLRWGMTPHPL